MLQVKTEEQKKHILNILSMTEPCCNFPLDFDKEDNECYEEFKDRVYIDGEITFDKMAKIVDYLRTQN